MDNKPQPSAPRSPEPAGRRLDTQIHRRKKAKAIPPLEAEWEADSRLPPKNLKMPADRMPKNH